MDRIVMASKPKGKKGRASYSNKSQASVGMTDAGPSNVKNTTSQVATFSTQDPEWMTLRSGTRLEWKEMMETLLGIILEVTVLHLKVGSGKSDRELAAQLVLPIKYCYRGHGLSFDLQQSFYTYS
jgi:hypothetical protein